MTAVEEQLRERVRDLQDRLIEATGQNLASDIRAVTGLSCKPARIVAMLYAARGVVTDNLIWNEIFADQATGDGPGMATIKVHISNARCRLKKQGIEHPTIVNDFNFGYRLTSDFRFWLKERLEGAGS